MPSTSPAETARLTSASWRPGADVPGLEDRALADTSTPPPCARASSRTTAAASPSIVATI